MNAKTLSWLAFANNMITGWGSSLGGLTAWALLFDRYWTWDPAGPAMSILGVFWSLCALGLFWYLVPGKLNKYWHDCLNTKFRARPWAERKPYVDYEGGRS